MSTEVNWHEYLLDVVFWQERLPAYMVEHGHKTHGDFCKKVVIGPGQFSRIIRGMMIPTKGERRALEKSLGKREEKVIPDTSLAQKGLKSLSMVATEEGWEIRAIVAPEKGNQLLLLLAGEW